MARIGPVNNEALARLERAASGESGEEKTPKKVGVKGDAKRHVVILDLGDGPRLISPTTALDLLQGIARATKDAVAPPQRRR